MKKDEKLKEYSQQLRSNATPEENTLWYQYLRRYPVQFRRQCVVGPYILDFYCAKALLAVELDGSQHYKTSGQEKDAERSQYLEALGIQVLRFPNTDIKQNLRGVCQSIDKEVHTRIAQGQSGVGRAAFSTIKTRGRETPHPPPAGAPFPKGEGHQEDL